MPQKKLNINDFIKKPNYHYLLKTYATYAKLWTSLAKEKPESRDTCLKHAKDCRRQFLRILKISKNQTSVN